MAFKLRLKSLSFISAVDRPAQSTARAAIIKSDGGVELDATAFKVVKTDEEIGVVFGWAFTTMHDGQPFVDSQGDVIQDDDLVKVAAEYAEAGGAVDEQHDETTDAGKALFLFPLTGEIAKALGIDTTVTGLLAGLKVSPDILARFKSGELGGFSIGGMGEREPLTKRATDAIAAKIAADVAKLKADAAALAKIAADAVAYEKGVAVEMHTYLDDLVAKGDEAFAIKTAERNRESAGRWGATWLEKHANGGVSPGDEIAKSCDPEHVEKAVNVVIAKTFVALEKARDTYESHVEAFAKTRYMDKTAAGALLYSAPRKTDSPELTAARAKFDELGKAFQKAQTDHQMVPEQVAAAPFIAKSKAIEADLAQRVETYALQHNLDPKEARDRLATISSSFKDLSDEWSDVNNAKAVAMAKAAHLIQLHHEQKRASVEKAAVAAKAAAQLAAESPAQKALRTHVETMAKSLGLPYAQALTRGMRSDPTTQELYGACDNEFMARQTGQVA